MSDFMIINIRYLSQRNIMADNLIILADAFRTAT